MSAEKDSLSFAIALSESANKPRAAGWMYSPSFSDVQQAGAKESP